jgi:tetratricopeptide (TPR) repeat protein
MMRRIVVLLVMAGVVAPGAAAHGTTSDAQHAARALAAERAGRLAEAYAQLGHVVKPSAARAKHRAALAAALQARAAGDALTRAGDDAGAKAVLDAARAKLDPDADRFAVVVLARRSAAAAGRVAQAAADALKPAAAAARTTIAKGDALGADQRWDDAAAVYKTVAGAAAGTLPADVRQTAALKQLRAERRAIEAEPGPVAEFFTSVWHGIRDALKWALIPILLLLALWIAHRERRKRPLAGRTSLALTDSGGEAKDQDRRDHALAVELTDAIQDVRYRSLLAEGSEVDEHRDLDGTAAPPVMIGTGASGKADAVAGDLEVDVGPLKVSPLKLYYFVRWALTRPGARELSGTLRADENGAELCVELRDLGATDGHGGHWSARATGATARGAVIREVAEKYVVESGYSYISESWRSYVAYRDALAALEAADPSVPERCEAALESARGLLERALAGDPANLLARMRLGAVLRTMGRNPEAAAQFARLRDDVRLEDRLPAGAAAFVGRHPELFYCAWFHGAVALGKWGRGDGRDVPRRLAMLVARLAPEPELPVLDAGDRPALIAALRAEAWTPLPEGADRERLYVLALCAWAASLVASVDRRDAGAPDEQQALRDRRRRVLERVEEVRERLTTGRLAGAGAGTALREGEAILDNAIARVSYRQGAFGDARAAAERALVLSPDLGDAHVTLAEVAMSRPGRRAEDWSVEAERHLTTALGISPKDARARYLLGKLYKSIGDFPKAKDAFGALATDWRALDQLGDVHLEEEALADAVRCFVRSQARNPSGDYRADRLVTTVLALRNDAAARLRPRDGEAILRAGQRAVDAAKPEKRETALQRLGALQAAVEELTARPAEPEPPLLAGAPAA